MLIDTNVANFGISLPLILGVSAFSGVFFLVVLNLAIKSRSRPVVSGREKMLDSVGVIEHDYQGRARVRVNGELWQVFDAQQFSVGEKVKVTGLDGLTLHVESVEKGDKNGRT